MTTTVTVGVKEVNYPIQVEVEELLMSTSTDGAITIADSDWKNVRAFFRPGQWSYYTVEKEETR